MNGDFSEKLNSILANPAMMAQIKALADTMTNGSAEKEQSAPQADIPTAAEKKEETHEEPVSLPEKALSVQNPLAGSLLSPAFEQNIQNTCALLRALKPFLDVRRRDKIDKVLNMMQLAQMAGKFGSIL